MTAQLTLISGAGREKTLVEIAVSKLRLSRFNTRKTRPQTDVERLAKRIEANGFELTRAPWAYKADDGAFEVFAGGTRLEAARLAGEKTIPVIVFTGFGPKEYAGLADEDNENDEYHAPVSPLDVWAEYHRLATEEGWTQQQIADAKGCDRAQATWRLKFHRALPQAARTAVCDGLFDEGHCQAIFEAVCDVTLLAAWLTTEQAQSELVAEVLGKHRGSTAGIRPTVKVVREAAAKWKSMIARAEEAAGQLDGEWRAAFVQKLASDKARTVAAVDAAFVWAARQRDAEAAKAIQAAESEAEKMRRETARAERITALTSLVHRVDAREAPLWPADIALLLTDPPYGMDYQSGRRTTTAKKARVAGDDDGAAAVALLGDVLKLAYQRMADNSTALVFTGWRLEPAFREAIEAAGFTLKGSLVWVKNNHGTGDLKGSFAPKHERILHAVKGKPELRSRPEDVLFGKDKQDSIHPTEKPLDLLEELIGATTDAGQIVADPFAGSGNTLFAAHALGRRFWGCEIDDTYHRQIVDRLHAIASNEG